MIRIKGKLAKIVKIGLFDAFGNEYHLDELAQSYLQCEYYENNKNKLTKSYRPDKLPAELVSYSDEKYNKENNSKEGRFIKVRFSNKIYYKKLYLVLDEKNRLQIQDIAPHKERQPKNIKTKRTNARKFQKSRNCKSMKKFYNHHNPHAINYIYFGRNLTIDDLNVTVDVNNIVHPVYDIKPVNDDIPYLMWLRSRALSNYGYCDFSVHMNTLDDEDDLLLYAKDEGFEVMTPDDFTVFCMATGRYETYLAGYVEALLYFLNKRLAVDSVEK